jgi:hypothetical protein
MEMAISSPIKPLPKFVTESPETSMQDIDLIGQRFSMLARQWKRERGMTSSAKQLMNHPAYLQIISLGRAALPYILMDLEREQDWWFSALRQISGFDPVLPESRGRIDAMTRDWLRWGRSQNVVW